MTLVHRWFNQGQGVQPPLCAQRVSDQARQHGRGKSRGPVVNERDLEATVLAMLLVANKPHGTIILVDARGFKAPDWQSHHIGTYYQNLHGNIRHDDFMQVWLRLMRRLRDELLSRISPMRPASAAFYCKSGKHRSVGLAWTLTKILREHDWNVELWHTMREYWQFGSCCECAECATDTPSKLALLAEGRPESGLMPD